MLELFHHHLRQLLPLANISEERSSNQVVVYAKHELNRLNRPVHMDEAGNLTSPRGPCAILAHTDSVDDGSRFRGSQQIEEGPLRWTNVSGHRPMGADDKVGVAIALTLAADLPDLTVWLLADEEVGLVGAAALQAQPVELGIECDRRGRSDGADLVIKIETTWLCSPTVAAQAATLLPHRDVVAGGGTDVLLLVQRGLIRNGMNLSCGYFEPHTREEFIVIADADQALRDAWTLLTQIELSYST